MKRKTAPAPEPPFRAHNHPSPDRGLLSSLQLEQANLRADIREIRRELTALRERVEDLFADLHDHLDELPIAPLADDLESRLDLLEDRLDALEPKRA